MTWEKRDKKWRAQLNHDKKRHSLGYYKLETDAALAHDEAAKQLKGPNTETNFASLKDYEKAKANELVKSGLSNENATTSSAIIAKVKQAISKQNSKRAGKSVGVGFSDGNEETEDESELAKRVAQDSARRSMRQRSTPELFVARPSKSGVGVKDGDEELSQTSCSNVAAAADKGSGNARLKSEEDSWQCHRCDTSNASARSRCSSCMGWKGGRQGWRYRDEESDEGQDDQCVSKPKRSKFSTRDNKKPSSCIPQAKANGDSTEDSASATAQRCSIKVDREFAKRVAQDSARRSIRQRSAPELFVARPSKSGVGVKDGDEEFLESKTSCSTVAAVTDKRSGSARLKSKDENVEEEDEDSWQCHRCDTSNASTRSRCTSCQGWKWKSGSSHPKSQQRSNDVALDRCMAQLPKVILNDQDFFAQHNSLCEVCGKPGELLCCETCNLVFHTSCTLPKLHKEPPNDWSCSYCCADGVRGGMKNGKKRLEAAKACREMEKTKKKHKKAREKALDSGTKDKERSVKVGVQSGGESSR